MEDELESCIRRNRKGHFTPVDRVWLTWGCFPAIQRFLKILHDGLWERLQIPDWKNRSKIDLCVPSPGLWNSRSVSNWKNLPARWVGIWLPPLTTGALQKAFPQRSSKFPWTFYITKTTPENLILPMRMLITTGDRRWACWLPCSFVSAIPRRHFISDSY